MDFLNSPIIAEDIVRKNISLKTDANFVLGKLVEFSNKVNAQRFAEAAKSNPAIASSKAKDLDESTVLELLIKQAANNDTFQRFLAEGTVDFEALAGKVKRK